MPGKQALDFELADRRLGALAEEVERLQRCINDLVSVLGLRATWGESEPAEIAHNLLDTLLDMLRLDFVYIRLKDPADDAPIEMVRVAPPQTDLPQPPDLCAPFRQSFGDDPAQWPQVVRVPTASGDVAVVPFSLGPQAEIGVVAAGSQRPDFPAQTERLLLSVAANQVFMLLHSSLLVREHKPVDRELDRLRANELESRLILDNVPAFVALLASSGEVELVNRQILDYTGKTTEELMKWGTSDLVHPDDLPQAVESFTRGINSGEPFEIVHSMRRFDGMYRWFRGRHRPLKDAEGRVVRWCVAVTDIDDAKRAEDALNRARSDLAHVARVSALSALTASIAHEVNQPLSGIITNASTCLRMLAADPPNVDGARDTAKRTIRDSERASEVITRLRGMFAHKEIATEPVDLNEAAREVIALSKSELLRAGVVVRDELAENLPSVLGDRVQLQQVMLNLIMNASDAMSGVDDRPRELTVKSEPEDGGGVRVSVQDSGVGFQPEAVERLFEAFYSTKHGGMGIGLSVSRSIIERHHGRLWGAANEGHGATFAFSVPESATSERANTKV